MVGALKRVPWLQVTDQFRTGPLESRAQDVSAVSFH